MSNYGFNKRYEEIKRLINTEILNVANDEELFYAVQIISTIMMQILF